MRLSADMGTNTFLNTNQMKERSIVIWGAGKEGKNILKILKDHNHQITCFVDTNAANICDIDGVCVKEKDFLKNNVKNYYVVVAIAKYYSEVSEYLMEIGYFEKSDYFWINRTPIEIDICDGQYSDDFGNRVDIVESRKLNTCIKSRNGISYKISAKLFITGKNNTVRMENVKFLKNSSIYVANGANVNMSDCIITGESAVKVNNSKLQIKNSCHICKAGIDINAHSEVVFSNTFLSDDSNIIANDNSYCNVIGTYISSKITVRRFSKLRIYESRIESNISMNQRCEANIEMSYIDEDNMLNIGNGSLCNINGSYIDKSGRYGIQKCSKFKIIETKIDSNCVMMSNNESEIILDDILINKNVRIDCDHNSLVKMFQCEIIGQDTLITCVYNSEILLGRNVRIQIRAHFISDYGSSLSMGEDSGLSLDVTILCGSSHPVFDITDTQEYYSEEFSDSQKSRVGKRVEIKNGVWIGKGCTILGGSIIGESSIVSAGSVTAKKYPNNCLIMGYPAKVVRTNIAWDKYEVNPDKVDKKYWKLTEC